MNKNKWIILVAVLALALAQVACDSTTDVIDQTNAACDDITGCVMDTHDASKGFCAAFMRDIGVDPAKVCAVH